MSSRAGKLRSPSLSIAAPAAGWDARRSTVDLGLRVLQRARGSLRAKFILAIATLIIVLMGAVMFVVDRHQRQAVLEQARLRALSAAKGLAAVSEGYLLSYNFIQLEQVVENLRDDEEDVVYALAHRRDGRVAVYSRRTDLQGKNLDDPVSQRALQATEPLVQDVIIPETAYALINKTRRDLIVISLAAILCGISLAVYMAMRIARPIGQLVAGVHEFAKGSYDHRIRVDSRDEIGYLAAAFQQLGAALQLHRASLEDEKRLLEDANRRLRETQQQLIESERLAAVGKLAARVAHEVNNPLAIIKTAIRIVRNQQADEPIKENLQEIEEEIGRIARIVRELLDVSRPSPTQEVVQVNRIVQGLEGLLAQSLREHEIMLSVVLDSTLPSVRISADQLKQVILNIVRNAEDAMPGGGSLSIHTTRQDRSVEIRIADTGCGIAEEHLRHVFDPFFTTKAKEQGMGIGLWVSYGVIQTANGTIAVDSELGKGSTFRVTLPGCEA